MKCVLRKDGRRPRRSRNHNGRKRRAGAQVIELFLVYSSQSFIEITSRVGYAKRIARMLRQLSIQEEPSEAQKEEAGDDHQEDSDSVLRRLLLSPTRR